MSGPASGEKAAIKPCNPQGLQGLHFFCGQEAVSNKIPILTADIAYGGSTA